MPFIRGRLEGAKELTAALEALGTEVSTKLGAQSVRAGAKELQDALIAAAPLGPGRSKSWKTKGGAVNRRNYGHLRDNIKVRKERARKQNHITYRVTTTNAFWGYFLEKGTVKMRAHPWMRPVFDRLHQRMLDVEIEILWAGIGKIAKRNARAANRAARMLPNGRNG